jgi:cob(I)alamin adenosyltransferase
VKIYTKKGDGGVTSLFSGRRTAKSDPFVAAVGDLDELSAALGLAGVAYPIVAGELRAIQHILYVISAILSAEGTRPEFAVADAEIEKLEHAIDTASDGLPELRDFIYPGESEASSRLHMARAIARRAERSAAALGDPVPAAVLAYLNRLSDLLFVWARQADFAAGHGENLLAGDKDRAG